MSGMAFEAGGDRLHVDARAGVLTDADSAALAASKRVLLPLLGSVGPVPRPWSADPSAWCPLEGRVYSYRAQMAGACSWSQSAGVATERAPG
jgi:hypothetical protein